MIDLKKLQDLFGKELPTMEQFRDNNEGHNISMRAIRTHVGMRKNHSFSDVWAVFVAEYDSFVKTLAPKAPVAKPVVKPVAEAKADDQTDA
jgi:hypothetical protein